MNFVKTFLVILEENNILTVSKGKEISLKYIPNSVIASGNKPSNLYLLKDRFFDDETYIYVCVDNTCKFPVNSIEEAIKLIE